MSQKFQLRIRDVASPPAPGTEVERPGTEVDPRRGGVGTEVEEEGTEVERKGTEVERKGTEVERRSGPWIAVIDSGVHAQHPHIQGVAGGIGIDLAGHLHDDYVDRLGHGTAVTAVIREKAPAAQILAIKVFDHELTTTGAALVAALHWATTRRVDMVNLSLGTTNPDFEAELASEVARARAAGIVIVSAGPFEGRRWLPGALPGVIRVGTDMTLSRDVCNVIVGSGGDVTITASGYPRPIPGVPPERNLKGISFAVANVCGILAHAWPAWPDWCLQAR